jgi:hypothetical protein
MRKIIFNIIFIILVFTSLAFADAFCDGWKDGYKAGYCYRQYACLEPLVPLCPLPRLGEDTYKDGYNRGFLAGLNARR